MVNIVLLVKCKVVIKKKPTVMKREKTITTGLKYLYIVPGYDNNSPTDGLYL